MLREELLGEEPVKGVDASQALNMLMPHAEAISAEPLGGQALLGFLEPLGQKRSTDDSMDTLLTVVAEPLGRFKHMSAIRRVLAAEMSYLAGFRTTPMPQSGRAAPDEFEWRARQAKQVAPWLAKAAIFSGVVRA